MTLLLALLAACDTGSEACISSKDQARTAWGEVSVRYSLALKTAEEGQKEPASRLAAMERRPDAPKAGKDALAAEVAKYQTEIETLRPKAETAEVVAGAFAGQKASDALALAKSMAPKLEGPDVAAALAKAEAAAAACGGVE